MIQRAIATLPDDLEELCLIRLGFQAHRITALPYLRRLARATQRAAAQALASGVGLLHHERFAYAWNHVGLLHYWRSFEALEAWSHQAPHADWWRDAVARGRRNDDFGLYHELYLVPRSNLESIYLNCEPVGLAVFGQLGEPVGPRTTSRDRLGRRATT